MKSDGVVLVTGGAGFIGSVLCTDLVKRGCKVRIFDKFYFGKDTVEHLKKKVEIIEGDIRKTPSSIFDNVGCVIHLAAFSNDPTAEFNPAANFDVNTRASIDLAAAAKKNGVKKFIFASSCSIYDLKKADDKIKSEKDPVDPKAPYSLSKYLAEIDLLKMADPDFCVTVLRKGTVSGFSPRMRFDLVVNTMVKNAFQRGIIEVYGNGDQWRPLVDVQDVSKAYQLALEADSGKINGQVINISFDNFRVFDLALTVHKVLSKLGIEAEVVKKEGKKSRSYLVSNKKAKGLLGFVPEISIEETVVRLTEKMKSKITDFENPVYYNIKWMEPKLMREKKL